MNATCFHYTMGEGRLISFLMDEVVSLKGHAWVSIREGKVDG